jgi:hypothetical protein
MQLHGLQDTIRQLSDQIRKKKDSIATEEATKTL